VRDCLETFDHPNAHHDCNRVKGKETRRVCHFGMAQGRASQQPPAQDDPGSGKLIRLDPRGMGMSDPDVDKFTLEGCVRDIGTTALAIATRSVNELFGALWPLVREGDIETPTDSVDRDAGAGAAPLVEEVHLGVADPQAADAHIPQPVR
jgi:hypothetical protein